MRFWLYMSVLLGWSGTMSLAQGEDSLDHQDQAIERLEQELPLLGHRNWIVVADMAYPAQTSPGIETFYVGGDHLRAIRKVMAVVDKAPHVRPVISLDKELESVSEEDAPGIDVFRRDVGNLLEKYSPSHQMHEAIIQELDEAGKKFKILILKTDGTLPYTSLFVRLDCGYWSEDAEKRLRKTVK